MFSIQGEDSTAQVNNCASDFVKLELNYISLFKYIKGWLAWGLKAMFGCKQ